MKVEISMRTIGFARDSFSFNPGNFTILTNANTPVIPKKSGNTNQGTKPRELDSA